MSSRPSNRSPLFRIWIVAYRGRRPPRWHTRPRNGRMLELADSACYSRPQAEAFLRGFNSHMLKASHRRWAVAIEVR